MSFFSQNIFWYITYNIVFFWQYRHIISKNVIIFIKKNEGDYLNMNIIICEDNLKQRKELESIINTEIEDFNFRISLSTDNPYDVLNYSNKNSNNISLYILDIDLKSDINGLELAKRIRENDCSSYIVFVTAHPELTFLTFQYKVRALDYIIKGNLSVLKRSLHDCFTQICDDLLISKNKEKNSILIDTGNAIVFIDLSDVLFFETADIDHKIRIHTESGFYEFYGTLKDTEQKLTSSYYKTHRSYLVNVKKIKSIDKENLIIHMTNGEICYLTSRYLKGLLEKCRNLC